MRAFFLISLVSACGSLNTTGGGDDDDAPSTIADGAYTVRSQIGSRSDAVLPEPAADLVATLRNFSEHPAHTLLDLADSGGRACDPELRAILPDFIEGQLEDWNRRRDRKVEISTACRDAARGELAAAAETAITQFELDSSLAVAGSTPRIG